MCDPSCPAASNREAEGGKVEQEIESAEQNTHQQEFTARIVFE